ncbi:MAG: PIN domain-containing protein [Candidatus Micrarchaeia archaeon]
MIADSSFLVSLFWKDDTLHQKALSEFRASSVTLSVPDRIIEETMSVLAYKEGWQMALEVLDRIAINRRFELRHLSREEWYGIVALSKKLNKKISFNDYLVIHLSVREGCLPLAYDSQLLSLARQLIVK